MTFIWHQRGATSWGYQIGRVYVDVMYPRFWWEQYAIWRHPTWWQRWNVWKRLEIVRIGWDAT